MKPSRGRISTAPIAEIFGLNVYGFLTRTVLDNALLLDQVHGYAPGDMYWSSPVPRPFADEAHAAPGRLRIGWTTRPPIDTPVHPAIESAVRDAAELCAGLGHEVEEHDLDWRDDEGPSYFITVWGTMFGHLVESLIKYGFDPNQLEPHNRALWELSKTIRATDYTQAYGAAQERLKTMVESWRTYDVIIAPVTAQLPYRLDDPLPEDDPLALLLRDTTFVPFNAYFNFTGQPAASWPLAWHEGLPIGVQAIGRPGDEATLYRLSAQVEAARPWADKRPPL
jgi:amidase